MAEVNTGGGDKGGKKSKKVSTKIDMTPMVDLAFLLITFFMLTTAFSKPVTMDVNMPKKEDDPKKKAQLKASHAITIILGEDDKIFWFQGVEKNKPKIEVSDYSPQGIRQVLLRKRAEIGPDVFVAVIKPMKKSNYKNMVDILDEMAITKNERFAIVKILPEDIELTKNL